MSNEKKDDNSKHYFKKAEGSDLENFLNNLAQQLKNSPIELAEKVGDRMGEQQEKFQGVEFNQSERKLLLKMEGGTLKKLMGSKLLGKTVYVKIDSQGRHFFCLSTLAVADNAKDYQIILPAQIFMGQKRSNYRLQASLHHPLKFECAGKRFPCVDVSAQGAGIILEGRDVESIDNGTEFQEPILTIKGKEFHLSKAQVVNKIPLGPKDDPFSRTQIGLFFPEIPNNIYEDLVKTIDSLAREAEIRAMIGQRPDNA